MDNSKDLRLVTTHRDGRISSGPLIAAELATLLANHLNKQFGEDTHKAVTAEDAEKILSGELPPPAPLTDVGYRSRDQMNPAPIVSTGLKFDYAALDDVEASVRAALRGAGPARSLYEEFSAGKIYGIPEKKPNLEGVAKLFADRGLVMPDLEALRGDSLFPAGALGLSDGTAVFLTDVLDRDIIAKQFRELCLAEDPIAAAKELGITNPALGQLAKAFQERGLVTPVPAGRPSIPDAAKVALKDALDLKFVDPTPAPEAGAAKILPARVPVTKSGSAPEEAASSSAKGRSATGYGVARLGDEKKKASDVKPK